MNQDYNSCLRPIDKQSLIINSNDNMHQFNFDNVFGPQASQEQVMEKTCQPILDHVINGYNGCFMVYGQTGTGKTYTMGLLQQIKDTNQGIVSMSLQYLFSQLDNQAQQNSYIKRSISISFMQIYTEEIFDLLNPDGKQLQIRQDKDLNEVFVQGLVTVPIQNVDQAYKLINAGLQYRTMGSQSMNSLSSRSHTILTVYVTQEISYNEFLLSNMSFIDLAGSERVKKSNSKGIRLEEAKSINTSLCALSNVISALSSGKKGQHIPYRSSKLTRILQNSLNAKSKIAIIGTLNSNSINANESYSTLLFASRCKQIQFQPMANKASLVKIDQNKQEINQLQEQLQVEKDNNLDQIESNKTHHNEIIQYMIKLLAKLNKVILVNING